MSHKWFFQYDTGQYFDIVVTQTPGVKAFRIREKLDASISYGIAQGENAIFEIQDAATGKSASYVFSGLGFGISPPIPKVPVGGSASTAGPWNDFVAPGFLDPEDFEGDASIQTPVRRTWPLWGSKTC